MTSSNNIILRIFASLFLLISSTSLAGILPNPATCAVANVTLNSIQVTDGLPPSGELLSQAYNATSCVGVYAGNDDAGGLNNPSPNIGQLGDGLLNGEDLLSGMEFITTTDLQALDPDGVKNDPGWIHLAHFNADNTGTNSGINYSSVGPVPGGSSTIDIGDLLSLALECTSGSLSDCDSMNWVLTTKLNIIDDVQALLGDATFDHLAFSIKAGNENSGGGWAVYDFNFNDIFATENNSLLNFNTPYKLGGTLNTADIGNKGVSHFNVWARDPANTSTQVPEPSTLLIFVFGIMSLCLRVFKTNI